MRRWYEPRKDRPDLERSAIRKRVQVDGMLIGDTLEITYTGTIDGEDTSNATVLKLIETAANPQ